MANLFVSLFSYSKDKDMHQPLLNGTIVNNINSYFNSGKDIRTKTLFSSQKLMYRGVDFGGNGFILEKNEFHYLVKKDIKYKDVILPLFNGDNINNNFNQKESRYIINFFDWDIKKAKEYSDIYQIIIERVKPYRDKVKDKSAKEKWWLYNRSRNELYLKLFDLEYCIVTAFTTKYLFFSRIPSNSVFSNALNICASDSFALFAILSSSIHELWARQFGSKLKNDLRYTPSDIVDTYPFIPFSDIRLNEVGKEINTERRFLMLKIQLGLTKTYNAFHAPKINTNIKTIDLTDKSKKEIEKQFGKQVWYLWNHLQKTEEACTWEEAVAGIEELRRLHVEMDNAVLEAYGWGFDSAQPPAVSGTERSRSAETLPIDLAHDFYEVDYLPENDRVRFTISPAARKEVLKRLLLLNHQRYEEEILQGLHKKKDVEKFYLEKGKEIPAGLKFSDDKKKSYKKPKTKKTDVVDEKRADYGEQGSLF